MEAKFKKMGTVQLINKVEKLNKEEKAIVLAILKQRGQDTSKWEEKSEEKLQTSGTVFEAEPEEELTPEEEARLSAAADLSIAESVMNETGPKFDKVGKTKKSSQKKEKKEKTEKKSKDAPAEGSKAEKILALLKEGKLSKYHIAKELDTYYSVVDGIEKRYLLK